MKNNLMKRKFKTMIYLLLPVIAATAASLQSAINGQQTARIGGIETVILVHFFGLLAAIIVFLVQGNTSLAFVSKTNLMVIIGGSLGVIIIFTFAKSFIINGALPTVMISVMVQLIISKTIDHFGLFGIERNPVTLTQIIAVLIMVSGIVLFQYKN